MDPKTRQKILCHSYFMVFGMVGHAAVAPLVKSIEDTYGFSHTWMGALLGSGRVAIIGPNGPVGRAEDDRAERSEEEAEEVLVQDEG